MEEPSRKYCHYCGIKVKKYYNFCINCGVKLEDIQVENIDLELKNELKNWRNNRAKEDQYTYKNSQWSLEDDRKLESEYKQGESINNLAKMFNRNTGQIRYRIKKISRGRFCFRCLAKVEINHNFCSNCGVKLKRKSVE